MFDLAQDVFAFLSGKRAAREKLAITKYNTCFAKIFRNKRK